MASQSSEFSASDWLREHPKATLTAKANIDEYTQIDVTISYPGTYVDPVNGTAWTIDAAVQRAVGVEAIKRATSMAFKATVELDRLREAAQAVVDSNGRAPQWERAFRALRAALAPADCSHSGDENVNKDEEDNDGDL